MDVEAVYRQYGPMVLRRCRALLAGEDGAFDAMKDVFVQTLRDPERLLRGVRSSVLLRATTEVCLVRLRRGESPPDGPHHDLLLRIAGAGEATPVRGTLSLLDWFLSGERAGTDSPGTLAVMLLVDGLTLEETALEMGTSANAVRRRLHPLRERLPELVEVLGA